LKFERLELAPAYKVVCDAIEGQILSRRLKPGDRLPTETELAAQFGLTRHTVREGIRMLEQGGLVRREAGRRLHVAHPGHGEFAPRASRALVLQRISFRNLWEVALDIECSSVRHAAGRIAPDQVERLQANVAAMEVALADGRSIIDLDVEFHAIIAEATGNPVLLLAREPVSLLFHPALDKIFGHERTRVSGPRRLVEAHRHIADALAAGDAVKALDWMNRHMVDFRRGYDVCGFDLDAEIGTMPA
jgi:DNA-binding FadR family transcriptional regulator